MSVSIYLLSPELLADVRHAQEDVPLIENGFLTAAGEIYLVSEHGHDCPYGTDCEYYGDVLDRDGHRLDINPDRE